MSPSAEAGAATSASQPAITTIAITMLCNVRLCRFPNSMARPYGAPLIKRLSGDLRRLDALSGQDAGLDSRGGLRGLHAQLLHQRATALEVLTQGVTGAAGTGVGDHQGSVRALVQPVDVDQLAGEVRGPGVVPCFLVK